MIWKSPSSKESISLDLRNMFEIPGRQAQSLILESGNPQEATDDPLSFRSNGGKTSSGDSATQQVGSVCNRSLDKGPASRLSNDGGKTAGAPAKEPRMPSDLDLMKERFTKLLLGEDMSGGGKGVSSALALSNAITNLAASVFGEQRKLEPMASERKMRWKKEIDWLLSVTDYIVEFVPSQQLSKDGKNMEIMVTQQRRDLLMGIPALRKLDTMLIDCLDSFKDENEFWYVSKDADESEKGVQKEEKWWLPTVKNGRASLGDSVYKNITVEFFDPEQFLSTMDMSSEHKVLDLKNRIEASIVIWKRKMHHKDGKSSWGSAVSLEKRELFEERAETILLLLKQRFPGLPQSSLDISKIQYNRDVGHAILESYSRVLESLANTVMSRIEDVLYADSVAQDPSIAVAKQKPSRDSSPPPQVSVTSPAEETEKEKSSVAGTPNSMTLSDFMGWNFEPAESDIKTNNSNGSLDSYGKDENEKAKLGNLNVVKKLSYTDKVELSCLRSPTARH